MKCRLRGPAALCAAALGTAAFAWASVKSEVPLSLVVGQCRSAVSAKVALVNSARGFIVLEHLDDLKGKTRFRKFKHNLSTGDHGHADEILSAVKVGDRAVLFYTDDAAAGITAFAHVRGFWYQVHARNEADPDSVWWSFTHQEKAMVLSFVGDSPTLEAAVRGLLAGKRVEVRRQVALNDKRIITVQVSLKDDRRIAAPAAAEPAGKAVER
jgi:hypothetical protein